MDNRQLSMSIYTKVHGDKWDFENINESCKDVDILIYSPTITAGLSYELDWFDIVFGYFDNSSCYAETCSQMLGWVWNVIDKWYYIHVVRSDVQEDMYIANYTEWLYNKQIAIDPLFSWTYTNVEQFYRDIKNINYKKQVKSKFYMMRELIKIFSW